jgi:hypothetical protein
MHIGVPGVLNRAMGKKHRESDREFERTAGIHRKKSKRRARRVSRGSDAR